MLIECRQAIDQKAEFVFKLVHDYDLRLLWDPFLRTAEILDDTSEVGVGVRTHCAVKYRLLGWGMTTEYVSFKPAKVAAVKMTKGPFFFKSFAASMLHNTLTEGRSELVYRLNFQLSDWIPEAFTKVVAEVLRWETNKRLQALAKFCGRYQGQTLNSIQLGADLKVVCPNPTEARFIYQEVFTDNCYLERLPTLSEAPLVVDVGSNIGLFGLRVLQEYPGARVICVEPGPECFAALQSNVGSQALSLNRVALSNEAGILPFYFYPLAPGNSSLHRRKLNSELIDKLFLAFQAAFPGWWKVLVGRCLFGVMAHTVWGRPRITAVPVRRLSDLLAEHPDDVIDLVKIDVERAELDVLQGLEAEDWGRIRHLVVEVTSLDWGSGHLERIVSLIQAKNFRVEVVENELSRRARLAIEENLQLDGRIDHLVFATQQNGSISF